MSWLFAPFAALLGVVLTTQVATNTLLGKALGNPYIPATVNMVIGFFATAILTWSLTSEWPSRELMRAAPWYAWFTGGLMGVIYLTGTILLAPRLGRRGVSRPHCCRPTDVLRPPRPFRLDWV